MVIKKSNSLKTALYNKEVGKIMEFTPKENDSFEIHFLNMFFKEFLQKNSKIDSQEFLSSFSKSFCEFLFSNSDKEELFTDESIFNLFPSCGTHSETDYGTFLSCERYDHDKDDLIKKEIYKNLNKFKRYLFTKTKKRSTIITDKLISLIWLKNPKNKDDLYALIGHQDNFFQKYSSEKKFNYFEAILITIKNAHNKNFSNWTKYWERGKECENIKATALHLNENYNQFHFNDWMHHYGQSKKVNGSHLMPLNSLGHKLAAFINRLKEINDRLQCHSCKGRIVPNWKYGHKSFDSFRVTVFNCHEQNCDMKNKGVYINKCTGCSSIIDSRDNLSQCSNKRNICKECHACCKPAHKEDHATGTCPQCLEPQLVVFYGNQRDKTNVSCFNCNFKINSNTIANNYNLHRFYYLSYLETSSLAIENKKQKKTKRLNKNKTEFINIL